MEILIKWWKSEFIGEIGSLFCYVKKEWKEITKRKTSKYHVDISEKGKKERTYKGIVYDSKTELLFLQEFIEPRLESGEIKSYTRQVEYVLQDKFKIWRLDRIWRTKKET